MRLCGPGVQAHEGLEDIKEISFQKVPPGHQHIYHVLIGKFDGSKLGKTREDFMDIMTNEFGLRMIVQYYALSLSALPEDGLRTADCPNLEAYWDHSFSFPGGAAFRMRPLIT